MRHATHRDKPLDFTLPVAVPYLPRIWSCARCHTVGQLAFRASGWAVVCPCPACPAPAVPDAEGNPTPKVAIRHWNWKQGGPQ